MRGYGSTGVAAAARVIARKAGIAQTISLAANLPLAAIVSILPAAEQVPFLASPAVVTNIITRIVDLLV
jgi:hypothetical protein